MTLSKSVRHPERSEAERALFPERYRPSAVEGRSRNFLSAPAAKGVGSPSSQLTASLQRSTPSRVYSLFTQARSFDSGSAKCSDKKNRWLAFAQDDGVEKNSAGFAS